MAKKISQMTVYDTIDSSTYFPIITGVNPKNGKMSLESLVERINENKLNIISVTYSELDNLISSNKLISGNKYLITDYQTVHEIPLTDELNFGEIEPIIVTAISSNKLSPIASSTIYPDDIIYYDYFNNQNMVYGCTKGYIYRRIDTKRNNDIGFDFRNVKFRRWRIYCTNYSEPTGDENGPYYRGNIVNKTGTNELYLKTRDFDDYFESDSWYRLPFNNYDYISPLDGFDLGSLDFTYFATSGYSDFKLFAISNYDSSDIYNNKIEQQIMYIIERSNNVIFANDFHNNNIDATFKNNTIMNGFHDNVISSDCHNNYFASGFSCNNVGVTYQYNLSGKDCSFNNFENKIGYNTFGDNFKYNYVSSLLFGKILLGLNLFELYGKLYAHNLFPTTDSGLFISWPTSGGTQSLFIP